MPSNSRRTVHLAAAFALSSGLVAMAAQPASAHVVVPPGCGSYSGQMVPANQLDDHSNDAVPLGSLATPHQVATNFGVTVGTQFADVIEGNAVQEVICGLGGDDYILGGSGNDDIFGGDGFDSLGGEEGADFLSGGFLDPELRTHATQSGGRRAKEPTKGPPDPPTKLPDCRKTL